MNRSIPACALAALILASAGAPMALEGVARAQDGVLEGPAAFGNWRDDKPGVVRHLRPADMPAPTPDESASNGAAPVPRPDGAQPLVPEGFAIELVADGIDSPRAIRFAPNGDLFVSNSRSGEVRVLRFEGNSAKPISDEVYLDGLDRPYGIAFYPPGNAPQWIYIAEADGFSRVPYKSGDLTAAGMPETLVDTISPDGHWTRDLVFSSDGRTLYFSVGSDSNVGLDTMDPVPQGGLDAWTAQQPLGAAWGKEQGRAAVLSFDPEGKNEKIVATGLRNCAGMALNPATGEPWCVVNERDALGDNVPFEYATSVKQGAFYGWPWYMIGDTPDPRWAAEPRADLKGKVAVPDVLFQAHSAPLNIAFVPTDAWGAEYKGDAFVAMHGSWNRGTRTGYKVVRLDFDAAGKPAGSYEDFVTGMVVSDAEVWGRPVGVGFGPDGSLFFSEDGSGTIWKVSKTR